MWRLKIADIADQYRKYHFAIADEDEQQALFREFGFDDAGGKKFKKHLFWKCSNQFGDIKTALISSFPYITTCTDNCIS